MNAKPIPILQKPERNAVLAAIQAIGLDPREFDLDESNPTEVKITHHRSDWSFVVRGGPGRYAGRYTIAEGLDRPYEIFSWDNFLPRIDDWLQSLKRDLDTPDLWAELRREAEWLRAGSDRVVENTLFTPEEQHHIARRLDNLANELNHTLSLSADQMQVLQKNIKYLVESSRRLGRKDWLNNFVGVMLGFMIGVVIPSESAHSILMSLFWSIGLLYPELSIE
jgi:hypothetical protein